MVSRDDFYGLRSSSQTVLLLSTEIRDGLCPVIREPAQARERDLMVKVRTLVAGCSEATSHTKLNFDRFGP